MIDRDGNIHCTWCGGTVPEDRRHIETCSKICAAALVADIRRRCREALEAQGVAPSSEN